MRRVFAVDVLECPSCGGRLRLLAAIRIDVFAEDHVRTAQLYVRWGD